MRHAWPLLLLLCNGAASAQVLSVELHGPAPDFGRFVGDLLTSTATVTVAPGTQLDRDSLPPPGPVSPIADLRGVTLGGTATRLEIRVTYQEFFAPGEVSGADIPGYSLVFSARGQRVTAAVPGFSFTASPFRHDLQPTLDPASMRPDHPPPSPSAPGAKRAIAGGLSLMAAGLLALIGLWAAARRRGPFAAAAAQHTRAAAGDAGRALFLALHRAFDATAGRHVFAGDIDDFVAQHPQFLPLRDRIAAFFAASQSVFFAEDSGADDASQWVALSRSLARAERRG
jgi:mxaA protein